MSHRRNIGDYTEAASAGYDFKLIGQVPYLPWAKIKGTRYHWLIIFKWQLCCQAHITSSVCSIGLLSTKLNIN
jgi:hypothetical protein